MSDNSTDLQGFHEADKKPGKKSTTRQLIELAVELYDFGTDHDGKPFGVRKGGHVVRPLVGSKRSIRQELGALFYRLNSRTAPQNALTDAMAVLEYEAEAGGEPVHLALRVARPNDDAIYIDMGDKTEKVIRVTEAGWEILEWDAEIPVLFRRTNLTAALPLPLPGGDLDLLWQFVNVRDHGARQLVTGWLVSTHMLVGRPCPIIAFLGEQGTAKTSGARSVFALADPTSAPVRRPPKDADRLLHAVHHTRGTIFDNLSSIPRWMSDSLCRCVTGESDVDRSLYTDADARVIQVQVVLGFTGIDVGVLAGDLAERCVWCDLEVMPDADRRSERELDAAWDEKYPSMFGGLLDLIVKTMNALPAVNLAEKPRMADFAEVLAALDSATGFRSLEHYTRAHESVAEEIVDTDKFLSVLTSTITERWTGTGKELYNLLPRPSNDKFWPEAKGISGKLRRHAPDLRKSGWTVEEIKPAPMSKRPKRLVLVPPEVQITDVEIAAVQFTRELRTLDIEAWTARALADGATPDCAQDHAEINRSGSGCTCRNPLCRAPSWKPEYRDPAGRSEAIDTRIIDDLNRLRLTFNEFDRLVADRGAVGQEEQV